MLAGGRHSQAPARFPVQVGHRPLLGYHRSMNVWVGK